MKKRNMLAGVVALVVTALAHAQATIPDATEMTTKITAIGGVAAAAAAVGFSIWLYRRVKSKAGQAVG